MEKKVVKLTESDLERIIKRVINEQGEMDKIMKPTVDVEAINDCINESVPDKSDLRGLFISCDRALTSLENGEIDKETLYTCTRDMMMDGTPDVKNMGYDLVKCFMDVLGKKY